MTSADLSITEGGRERADQVALLLAETFTQDPVIAYLLNNMSQETRIAYLPQYFKCLMKAAALNHGTFSELNEFKSVLVVIHPGNKVDNPWTMLQSGLFQMIRRVGWGACSRMLFEFASLTDGCKLKGLRGFKKYYYIFFASTHASSQGQGLCPKLIKYWQEVAAHDKVPIWLESTTEKSMRVYSRCGFEVVEELRLGKGKVESDGVLSEKRKEELGGVPLWGMVWWPAGIKPGN